MRATRIKTPKEKCYVCKLVPDCNHWKNFEVEGRKVPVCSKLCAVHGLFIPRPERKHIIRRNWKHVPSAEGLEGAI